MNKLFKKAFTLIELLVVIAIIGILSGLIIVGMNNSVQSANIAKSQIFDASLRDSLLGSLISEWKLDEGSGTTTSDVWSGGNTCSFVDAGGACSTSLCPQWQTANCIYGKCLSFNGTGAYLNCGTASNLTLNSNFTISLWFNPANNGGVITKAYPFGGYGIYLLSGSINVQVAGWLNWVPTTAIMNKWQHVVLTFNNPNVSFYKNGVLAATATRASNNSDSSHPLLIGADYNWNGSAYVITSFLSGLIDNIRIYNSPIPVSLIAEEYYAGLNRLLAKEEITKDEYQNKVLYLIGNNFSKK